MSLILRVDLGYDASAKLKAMTHTERDMVRSNVLALKDLEEPNFSTTYYYPTTNNLMVTEEELVFLRQIGIEYTIKDFKNTYRPQTNSGNNYHYHLPNIGLLMIDEVTWLEDACTEGLQDKLNQGWRIIAVCPPNGARRPDYILGRTQSNSKD